MISPASDGHGALHRFVELAAQDPEAPFLTVDRTTLTRGAFLKQVAQVTGGLRRRGVREGDAVVLCCQNRVEWYTAFWACVALGARPAPLDPATGSWELRQLLPLLAPRLAIAAAEFKGVRPAERLQEALPGVAVLALDESPAAASPWQELLDGPEVAPDARGVGPDEPLLYASTSGTTGAPKILVVPHLGFVRSQLSMAGVLGLTPADRMLLGMPLFHQGGFGMGLQALLVGAQAHYVQTFDPTSFLDHVQRLGITVTQLSPTLGKLLLTVPGLESRQLSSWRMAYFAGELLPDELARRFWRDRSLRVVNVVGSSETATMLVWDSASDDTRGSVNELGVPSFVRVRLLDEAEAPVRDGEPGVLWVHTDALLTEYKGNPTLTADSLRVVDGQRWYCTGDIVRRLPNGRYQFVGRIKRVVKRGPNLVHPEEIESFLLGHPAIAAVAVDKEPHPIFGESLIAWIQPRPDARLSRADVLGFCRGQISSYKIPDQLRFVERIPTDVGKVQHRRLQETSTAEHRSDR